MEYAEVKRLWPSRMDKSEKNSNKAQNKAKKTGDPWIGKKILYYGWGLGILAIGYYLIGLLTQYADPTAAWLDLGTISLALFAAWSCMLGIGLAGLLPVIYPLISKKGGIKKWKKKKGQLWSMLIFIGYIAVLCCLL